MTMDSPPVDRPSPDRVERLIALNRALLTQQLLRGIAHDLRNNLQVVALGSSIGEDLGGISVNLRVDRALDDMAATLDLMTRLGKSAVAEEPETDLAAAIDEAVWLAGLQRSLPGLGLAVERPPSPVTVRMPRGELVQVLLNLIANAREATELSTDPVVLTGTMAMDGQAAVTVDDAGPGIPPSGGTPFASSKSPANHGGLGLFVSRALVEGRGGTVSWDRRPQGGTRVRVVLPVTARG
jgi:C4-dicarboxylate-specific signal transduction histidine kinase